MQWRKWELGGRGGLLSVSYPSPPIPFKWLVPEIFMLTYAISTSSDFQMDHELNLRCVYLKKIIWNSGAPALGDIPLDFTHPVHPVAAPLAACLQTAQWHKAQYVNSRLHVFVKSRSILISSPLPQHHIIDEFTTMECLDILRRSVSLYWYVDSLRCIYILHCNLIKSTLQFWLLW